mgnify:FL=1
MLALAISSGLGKALTIILKALLIIIQAIMD